MVGKCSSSPRYEQIGYTFSIYRANLVQSHYAHDVVLTSVRGRFNVMDVVWMSKRCRVLIGITLTDITSLLPY